MGVNGFVAVDDIAWVNNDRCETKPAWADPEATTTQEPPTVTTEIPPSELRTAINMYFFCTLYMYSMLRDKQKPRSRTYNFV
jgi:hypothetical protein